jgi:hypothetical protein
MELEQLGKTIASADEMAGQVMGEKGFARSRRTIEDRLSLALDGMYPRL